MLEQLTKILPLRISIVAGGSSAAWPSALAGCTELRSTQPCDVGVVQTDDVTVDVAATRTQLATWLSLHGSLAQQLASDLRAMRPDAVLGDVPSLAFAAAKLAHIPSVAIANFSWDWIYSSLGFDSAAAVVAQDYAKADLLLEATPFAPMVAFPRRRGVGLIARRPSACGGTTRSWLGAHESQRLVLLAFQPGMHDRLRLPPETAERRFLVPAGWPQGSLPPDVSRLPADLPFLDALAAADVVVGKPGYGLIGDVEACGARFLHVSREGFPENAVLTDYLRTRAGTVGVLAEQFLAGEFLAELERLESVSRPSPLVVDGAERAAVAIAEVLGVLGVDSERRAD